ncbi:MAG: leucine-rich repeat domain-containing protein [Muribaculaceae bacterium]|nr:leucine-rich repeat domain-containing protein [Muribaculaceae bacterium]
MKPQKTFTHEGLSLKSISSIRQTNDHLNNLKFLPIKRLMVLLLIALQSILTTSAYDFSAKNDDGVTIYYKYSQQSGVAVTYKALEASNYSGVVNIPSFVKDSDGNQYRVTEIGNKAFYYCADLTSVTIPETVTIIDNNAFYKCTSLTSMNIPNSVVTIRESVFYGCECLEYVNLPESVSSIGAGCFVNCIGLKSIIIPESVTGLGKSVFESCTGLTSVDIGGSSIIPSYAFYNCSNLNKVTITGSVKYIDDHAFDKCISLSSVTTIPNSVTKIGEYAFNNCVCLSSITIPESVTEIGDYAFCGCTELETVNFNAINCSSMRKNDESNVFKDCINFTKLNIGDKVQKIPNYAFYNCEGIRILNIPNSVTSIGESAFFCCKALEELIIGNSVTYIGKYAFEGNSLTSLIIPNSVEYIESRSFLGPSNLTLLVLGKSLKSIEDGAFPSNIETIRCENPTPPHLSEYGVFSSYCYQNCDLRVPEGCIEAYKTADQWENFINISVNDNFSMENSDGVTIYYKITSSTSPLTAGVTTGNYSGDINIPEFVTYLGNTYSVTSIEDEAFYFGAKGLTSVTLPNSIISIGKRNFNGCSNLKAFYGKYASEDNRCLIKDGSLYAFAPSELNNYYLSESVTSIEERVFYDCNELTFINLGTTIENIGDEVFFNCRALEKINCGNPTPPTLGYNVFENVNKQSCELVVPEGSIEAYRAADQWKEFYNISRIENIENDSNEENKIGEARYYDLRGIQVSEPFAPGVYIRRVGGKAEKVLVK